MKFLSMVKSKESGGPPPPELIQAIYEMGVKETEAGTLVLTGGLGPSKNGAVVALRGGEITVTDGPFAEAKELVGGFAIFEVESKEQAVEKAREFIELHRKHWPGWEGESEIRPMETELGE